MGDYFRGQIDEVRVYNRALSAAEIQADGAVNVTYTRAGDLTGVDHVNFVLDRLKCRTRWTCRSRERLNLVLLR